MSESNLPMPVEYVALGLEAAAEARGWGKPPVLFVGRGPYVEGATLRGVDDLFAIAPVERAAFVAYASEAWTYPDALLREYDSEASIEALYRRQPPSRHPQRVELRIVTVVAPSGEVIVARKRGGEPEVELTGFDGRVIEQLRRIAALDEGTQPDGT